MGKVTKTNVSYACDNCGSVSTSRENWYGISTKSIYGLDRLIFCTEGCAEEWPAKHIVVIKLTSSKVWDMFAESEPYRVMGNTD